DQIRPGVEESLRLLDGPVDVTRPFGLEGLGCARTARPELDPHLRLRFEPRLLHTIHQSKPVVGWQRDEAARDLDDVEADRPALPDVVGDCLLPLRDHVLDEPSSRDEHVVPVADVDDLAQSVPRQKRERPPGELECVHVPPHGLEHILEIARAHWRVVGATDLCHATRTRLLLPLVRVKKAEGAVAHDAPSFPMRASRPPRSRILTSSRWATVSSRSRRSAPPAWGAASCVNFSVTRSQLIGRVTNPS